MEWSATQYSKFEGERNRPTTDLLAQVPNRTAAHAADTGCGPGNSTELLQQRFPDAAIIGIDSSADMVEAARKRLAGVRFEIDDLTTWRGAGPFEVILATAVLQWLPDHASLLPTLIGKLAPRGSLAVQIPDNLDEPAHYLMRKIAAEGPWVKRLSGAARTRNTRQDADWYYNLLRSEDAAVNVWRTTYYHPLAGGPGALVEWFKGTGLRPFLGPLEATERAAFLARYETALAQAYPALPDGTVLLPFPRLFFVATR